MQNDSFELADLHLPLRYEHQQRHSVEKFYVLCSMDLLNNCGVRGKSWSLGRITFSYPTPFGLALTVETADWGDSCGRKLFLFSIFSLSPLGCGDKPFLLPVLLMPLHSFFSVYCVLHQFRVALRPIIITNPVMVFAYFGILFVAPIKM